MEHLLCFTEEKAGLFIALFVKADLFLSRVIQHDCDSFEFLYAFKMRVDVLFFVTRK